ncbi:putative endoglucanase-4 [Glarea lozoyensis 74030]|uniref:Putative endoglucanase-4 n=1 Tax=Glarea lozoyensis (strain ATCC 74030 / MF5533) TaxID=1104152 RepID=H0EGU9_GLAL7|nr:putative endoglucanase-4 [Glarea lozoyensis 74030]
MRVNSISGVVVAAASTVAAHGYIDRWTIADKNYTGYNPSIAPNLNTSDINCSINATNAQIDALPVEAGGVVNLHWTEFHVSHHGPIFSYLAACNGDCATVDKTQLKWFKIAELGQTSYGVGGGTTGEWAVDKLRANDGNWAVTIPSSIVAGNYVFRNEILALHSAYDVGGAQFYPQCANIRITGSVHYGIYNDEAKPVYVLPGPPLCPAFNPRMPHVMNDHFIDE